MISTKYTFGGASISLEIRPVSKTTPMDPTLAPNVTKFLSMMLKAGSCGMESPFSRCLDSFLEEMDIYLDDKRIGQREQDSSEDLGVTKELEKFLLEGLNPRTRRNLKKLGRSR